MKQQLLQQISKNSGQKLKSRITIGLYQTPTWAFKPTLESNLQRDNEVLFDHQLAHGLRGQIMKPVVMYVAYLTKILNIVQSSFWIVNVIRLVVVAKASLNTRLLKENESISSNPRVLGRILALELNPNRWFLFLTIEINRPATWFSFKGQCCYSNRVPKPTNLGKMLHSISHIKNKNKNSIPKLDLFILRNSCPKNHLPKFRNPKMTRTSIS